MAPRRLVGDIAFATTGVILRGEAPRVGKEQWLVSGHPLSVGRRSRERPSMSGRGRGARSSGAARRATRSATAAAEAEGVEPATEEVEARGIALLGPHHQPCVQVGHEL